MLPSMETSAAQPVLLVVDDHEQNRDLLSRWLTKRGHRVLVACDGQEALVLIEGGGVDLVLLDIMMPGMSGLEVLREVRRWRSEVELPVIMATAKSESDDMVEALGLGANDYVTKPLDLPVVLARVEAQLRQRRRVQGPKLRSGTLAAGVILDGRYRIEAAIGAGAFGAVYRARHLEFGQDVAVKVLKSGVTGDAALVARFRREAISACRVKHPNAVTVLDFGVADDGTTFLVMELLTGRSLADALEAEGAVAARTSIEIAVAVCDALVAAHQAGVIHRDIKPSNIFLHANGRDTVVKVLDFGIAKVVGDATQSQSLTAEGALVGTPAYMAPERLSAEPYCGKSDVFSLGATLYEMLTGRTPFGGRDVDLLALMVRQVNEQPPLPSAINPAVPRALEAVVLSAMHKRPEARPSAAELRRELAALA
jgi:CheY-like chemotaxis protein